VKKQGTSETMVCLKFKDFNTEYEASSLQTYLSHLKSFFKSIRKTRYRRDGDDEVNRIRSCLKK